jgi:hypothetical protein
MMAQSAGQCLTGASDELCQVRNWLLQPSAETLEACPRSLDRAAAYLKELSGWIDPSNPNPDLVQPLLALSKDIRYAQRLLYEAGSLYFQRLERSAAPAAPAATRSESLSVIA